MTPSHRANMGPDERLADASAGLHAAAHEMDLGPESGPNKSGHALIAKLARQMGRSSSTDFTERENDVLKGLMMRLKRFPALEEARQVFQNIK